VNFVAGEVLILFEDTVLNKRMKLFVNNRPIEIIDRTEFDPQKIYTTVFDHRVGVTSESLIGDVLIKGATLFQIDSLLNLLELKKIKRMNSVTLLVKDREEAITYVKDHYRTIKAAGGIVVKGDKILMIYRLGRWDLPKGKIEKKEKTSVAAIREVEEECNIKVSMLYKLCTTWHTYSQQDRKMLKKTNWYVMQCLEDGKMRPQGEEGITDLRWMNRAEVREALKNSYNSIRDVVECYFKALVQSL